MQSICGGYRQSSQKRNFLATFPLFQLLSLPEDLDAVYGGEVVEASFSEFAGLLDPPALQLIDAISDIYTASSAGATNMNMPKEMTGKISNTLNLTKPLLFHVIRLYQLLWKPSPKLEELASVYDEFFSTLPDGLLKGLLIATEEVHTNVIMPLLNSKPDWLRDVFLHAVSDYQRYLAGVSVPWQMYFSSEDRWETLRQFESKLFHPLCAVVKENEDLLGGEATKETLSGIAVLFDHDAWILNLLSKDAHAQERLIAIPEFLDMEGYYVNGGLCLTATLTIIARDMKEEHVIRNGKTLARWLGSYTKDLESYLDTLTILVDPSKMKALEVSEDEIRAGRAEPVELDFSE